MSKAQNRRYRGSPGQNIYKKCIISDIFCPKLLSRKISLWLHPLRFTQPMRLLLPAEWLCLSTVCSVEIKLCQWTEPFKIYFSIMGHCNLGDQLFADVPCCISRHSAAHRQTLASTGSVCSSVPSAAACCLLARPRSASSSETQYKKTLIIQINAVGS